MPTTNRSAKPKSPLGTSGPEDKEQLEPSCENHLELHKPDLPALPAAAAPADDSAKQPFRSGQNFLTQQDLKLARYMNREIAKSLGLASRTRSVRV